MNNDHNFTLSPFVTLNMAVTNATEMRFGNTPFEVAGGTETIITVEDGAADDYFGKSVVVSPNGNTIVIGTFKDDDNGTNAGSAYIIRLD